MYIMYIHKCAYKIRPRMVLVYESLVLPSVLERLVRLE